MLFSLCQNITVKVRKQRRYISAQITLFTQVFAHDLQPMMALHVMVLMSNDLGTTNIKYKD